MSQPLSSSPTPTLSSPQGNVLAQLARIQGRESGSLTDSVELYESVFEHFPGGLCVFDKNMNMTACNERFRRLLDGPPELFADGFPSIEELFRFKARRGEYGPGDVEQHVKSRLRLVLQGQSHRYERRLPDGRIIEVRGRPLAGGGFITTYMDVTERRRESNKIQALIDGFPGGFGVFDENLQMIFCNEFLGARIPHSHALFADGMPSLEQYVWHNAKYGEYGSGSIAQIASNRLGAIRGKRIIHHETVDADGRCFAVQFAPTKFGGYVETHLDVTQDRQRSRQLEVMLQHFPGGVVMYDPDLNVVLYNDQLKRLVGYPDSLFESPKVSLERLLRHSAEKGEFGEGNIEELIKTRLDLIKQNAPRSLDRSTSAGVDLEITSVPLEGGGLLATYFDVTEKNKEQAQSLKMANLSETTGLPNRSLFRYRLDIALAQAERGIAMALLYLDIHDFKRINELYGQQVGDAILGVIGNRFLEHKRDTDTYAHLGGDLFAVIQVGIHDMSGAEVLANRVLRLIREPIEINGNIVELDACIGIALAPENGTFADIIDSKASTALHHAKDIGPGMFMFFHSCVNRLHI